MATSKACCCRPTDERGTVIEFQHLLVNRIALPGTKPSAQNWSGMHDAVESELKKADRSPPHRHREHAVRYMKLHDLRLQKVTPGHRADPWQQDVHLKSRSGLQRGSCTRRAKGRQAAFQDANRRLLPRFLVLLQSVEPPAFRGSVRRRRALLVILSRDLGCSGTANGNSRSPMPPCDRRGSGGSEDERLHGGSTIPERGPLGRIVQGPGYFRDPGFRKLWYREIPFGAPLSHNGLG